MIAQPQRVERLVLVSAAGLHIAELRLDTGHVPMLERPGRFNADVRAFMEE